MQKCRTNLFYIGMILGFLLAGLANLAELANLANLANLAELAVKSNCKGWQENTVTAIQINSIEPQVKDIIVPLS